MDISAKSLFSGFFRIVFCFPERKSLVKAAAFAIFWWAAGILAVLAVFRTYFSLFDPNASFLPGRTKVIMVELLAASLIGFFWLILGKLVLWRKGYHQGSVLPPLRIEKVTVPWLAMIVPPVLTAIGLVVPALAVGPLVSSMAGIVLVSYLTTLQSPAPKPPA